MTTIIYQNGEILADSRITFHLAKAGEPKRKDDFVKIRQAERFVYQGEMVQVYAIAGDAHAYTFFELFEKYCHAENGTVDILDEGLYGAFLQKRLAFSMLVVTNNHVAVVGVNEQFQVFHLPQPKEGRVGLGSGPIKIQSVFMSSTLDPRTLMRHAMHSDKGTGGTITSWTKERGIQTHEPMMGLWEFFKKMIKNDLAALQHNRNKAN